VAVSLRSNISSLTAQRRLEQATGELTTIYERLASGRRINRASDDAAGLAVASALNADKRVYNVAGRNLNDAISTSAIINGALDNQGNILGRLAELAEQSANGTLSNAQRKTLQREFDSLSDEYDRISATTIFNGRNLLQGGEGIDIQAGIRGDANSRIAFSSVDSRRASGNINPNTIDDYDKDGTSADWLAYASPGGVELSDLSAARLRELFGNAVIFTTANETGSSTSHDVAVVLMKSGDGEIAAFSLQRDASSGNYGQVGAPQGIFIVNAVSAGSTVAPNGKLNGGTNIIQVSDEYQSYTLDVDLGELTFFSDRPTDLLYGATIDTNLRARDTLDVVNNRIAALSALRGKVGATESRIQIALNLVTNASVVRAAAEGRILDSDIAGESARLVQSQIKQQAAASVLAQANQQPALALQLLRG
jgi:flagellin